MRMLQRLRHLHNARDGPGVAGDAQHLKVERELIQHAIERHPVPSERRGDSGRVHHHVRLAILATTRKPRIPKELDALVVCGAAERNAEVE
eukprot:7296134-Prymnesium_polylepis.1